jgi:simple sugar transport system ATP-binding protein
MANSSSSTPLIELREITKEFVGVKALDSVSLSVGKQEVLGLLGENGAGKSTLMKVMFGLYRADHGSVLWQGEQTRFHSPGDAIQRGIGMVHQHFNLVDHHTVLENIIIGTKENTRFGLINYPAARKKLRDLSARYGLDIDPESQVWQLSVGEKQRVEILKALYRDVTLLILDEPTAVLTPKECEQLFKTLRNLVASGLSIIFISHKLNEVMEITDRCLILRHGRVAGEVVTSQTSKQQLAAMMVGSAEDMDLSRLHKTAAVSDEVMFATENLHVRNDLGLPAIQGLNLEIPKGAIVGLAGVSGNGQRELAEVIAGVRSPESGRVLMDGKDVTGHRPSELVLCGMGRIPEDRHAQGLVVDFNIAENLALLSHDTKFSKGPFLQRKQMYRHASELIKKFDIRPPKPKQVTRTLSGGNIQKILLARELSHGPKAIIASQPTRGLDIHAANFVQELLEIERQKGVSVLYISEDLDELFKVSDIICVIYEGRIIGQAPIASATREQVGEWMMGISETEASNPSSSQNRNAP